jgi:hypothetical protein
MIKRYNGFTVQKLLIELFSIFESYESEHVHVSGDFLAKLKNISNQNNNVGKIASVIVDIIEDHKWIDDK